MDHSTRLELLACLVERFEDFLEKRGIDIPNPEKEEDPNASLIYGSDFGELTEGLEKELIFYGLLKEEK